MSTLLHHAHQLLSYPHYISPWSQRHLAALQVRMGHRVGFGIPELPTCGHKDFKGVPREPRAEGGMYFPRTAAQHFFMGSAALLNQVDSLTPDARLRRGSHARVCAHVSARVCTRSCPA